MAVWGWHTGIILGILWGFFSKGISAFPLAWSYESHIEMLYGYKIRPKKLRFLRWLRFNLSVCMIHTAQTYNSVICEMTDLLVPDSSPLVLCPLYLISFSLLSVHSCGHSRSYSTIFLYLCVLLFSCLYSHTFFFLSLHCSVICSSVPLHFWLLWNLCASFSLLCFPVRLHLSPFRLGSAREG